MPDEPLFFQLAFLPGDAVSLALAGQQVIVFQHEESAAAEEEEAAEAAAEAAALAAASAAAVTGRAPQKQPPLTHFKMLLVDLSKRLHAAGRSSPALGYLISAFESAAARAAVGWRWWCSLPAVQAASSAAERITHHRGFDAAMQALVALNILVMCIPYEGMPARLNKALDLTNSIFAFLFVAEMTLQMAGEGLGTYLATGSHKLDVVINVMSVADFALSAQGSTVSLSAIRCLRMLRVLRVIKLVRHFEVLRIFIESLAYTVSSLTNFLVLMCLIGFAFALCGMQVFGCGAKQTGAKKLSSLLPPAQPTAREPCVLSCADAVESESSSSHLMRLQGQDGQDRRGRRREAPLAL